MKFIKIVPVLAAVFFSCAPEIYQFRNDRNKISFLEPLTTEEANVFENNWNKAEKMTEQDIMASIGTDSVIKKIQKNDIVNVRGYIVQGNLTDGMVYFYSYSKDSIVNVVAATSFSKGRLQEVFKDIETPDSSVIKTAICLQKAKTLNRRYLKSQKVNYLTYSFYSDTGITIFLAPGPLKNFYIFCGGIKVTFDIKCSLLSNVLLHESIVAYNKTGINNVLVRTSGLTEILNEVDITQFLHWKDTFNDQTFITSKYTFILKYLPDKKRLIRKVFIRTEGNEMYGL